MHRVRPPHPRATSACSPAERAPTWRATASRPRCPRSRASRWWGVRAPCGRVGGGDTDVGGRSGKRRSARGGGRRRARRLARVGRPGASGGARRAPGGRRARVDADRPETKPPRATGRSVGRVRGLPVRVGRRDRCLRGDVGGRLGCADVVDVGGGADLGAGVGVAIFVVPEVEDLGAREGGLDLLEPLGHVVALALGLVDVARRVRLEVRSARASRMHFGICARNASFCGPMRW